MKNTEHLTPIAAANKLVAWHTSLDLAARRVDGEVCDSLYINGKKITPPNGASLANWPTQFVVTACRMSVAAARAWVFAKCALMASRNDKPKLNAEKVYSCQSDPSHGWISVPIKTLFDIGIADKVSACSYIRGGSAYLEEDADATLFFDRMRELGVEPRLKSGSTDNRSPIRSYDPYRVLNAAAYLINKELEKTNA